MDQPCRLGRGGAAHTKGKRMPDQFDVSHVRVMLKRVTWDYGFQSHWARANGFDPGYISAVINGYRPPNEDLLKALGFRERTVYEPLLAQEPKPKRERRAHRMRFSAESNKHNPNRQN